MGRNTKEYNSKYYNEHREKRLAEGKQKLHCDICKIDIKKYNMAGHRACKTHLKKAGLLDKQIVNTKIIAESLPDNDHPLHKILELLLDIRKKLNHNDDENEA